MLLGVRTHRWSPTAGVIVTKQRPGWCLAGCHLQARCACGLSKQARRCSSICADIVHELMFCRVCMDSCCVGVCRQNFDTAMAQQRAEIERLNNSISTLRQERDRVIMVGVHVGP